MSYNKNVMKCVDYIPQRTVDDIDSEVCICVDYCMVVKNYVYSFLELGILKVDYR